MCEHKESNQVIISAINNAYSSKNKLHQSKSNNNIINFNNNNTNILFSE
jgi:hypothetical protein